jgi:hypothetical protein
MILGLALERVRHLLRHHAAAEDPCCGVADDAFEAALEALHEAHGVPPSPA